MQLYWPHRNELSEAEGLILKGERILVPSKMRNRILKNLHEGHLGIEKTKQLAREFVFWPGMNAEIADKVSSCSICLENRNSNQKEPMKLSEIPDLPWEAVGTDLFH